MENKKLLAFDIDGTILPRGYKAMPIDTRLAIDKAHRLGHHVMISTGRCPYFIPSSIKRDLDYDYLVTINGALVTDANEEPIDEHYMSLESCESVIASCLKYDVAFALKCKEEMPVYNRYADYVKSYIDDIETPAFLTDYTTKRDYHLNHNVYGIFIIGSDEAMNHVKDENPEVTWVIAYEGAKECYPIGTSKKEGIKFILDKYGLTYEDLICFGDGENDIEMLSYAKVGVALGNASDKVKASASYVSSDCDKGGIADALKHFNII